MHIALSRRLAAYPRSSHFQKDPGLDLSFSSPRALPGKEEGVRPKGKGSPGTPNLTKTTKLVE
ncbi:hypothetical protein LguiB_036020 [Lonicera macranthoides]